MIQEKNYDLDSVIVIGDPFNNKYNYPEQVIETQDLSPFIKKEITIGRYRKKFNSVIQYLLSIRLCYNDAIKKLNEDSPSEAYNIYKQYKNKCERVFGIKIGINVKSKDDELKQEFAGKKNEYRTVEEYIIKNTIDALNVLYTISTTNKNFIASLLKTKGKTIIFHENDEILGDGLDGKGKNLYGKKLMEIRNELVRNEMRDAISSQYLTKIFTIKTVYDINSLSVLEKWAVKKIETVCKITAMFFEYLCIERKGFLPIHNVPVIINPIDNDKLIVLTSDTSLDKSFKELRGEKIENYISSENEVLSGWKMSNKNLSNVKAIVDSVKNVSVNPKINSQMTIYTIREILHCNILNTFENVSFPEMTTEIEEFIKDCIIKEIKNPYVKKSVTIAKQSCKDIWIYVCTLCEYLIIQLNSNENQYNDIDIEKLIKNSEEFVSDNKRDFADHGFNLETENCVAQYILYIICAITDWLDVDYVTYNEFKFCEKLLELGNSDFEPIAYPSSIYTEHNKKLLNKLFNEKGLIIYQDDLATMANFLHHVAKLMYDKEKNPTLVNRVYFYSNFI